MVAKRAASRHLPSTHVILEVLKVDEANLKIHYKANNKTAVQTVDLSEFSDVPLATHLFVALESRIEVGKSSSSIHQIVSAVEAIIAAFGALGITCASDKRLNAELLKDLPEAVKKKVEWWRPVLMDAFVYVGRGDLTDLDSALQIQPRQPKDNSGYDDDEIKFLNESSRNHLKVIEHLQKMILKGLGFDVAGRAWWQIPAQDVIDAARKRDQQRPDSEQVEHRRQCRHWFSQEQTIDWLLLHPTVAHGARGLMRKWYSAIYPTTKTLFAAGVLMMLSGARGHNPSTWMGFSTRHLTQLSGNFGQVSIAKKRARKRSLEGVNLWDKHGSLGGLMALLQGLTRFTRLHHTNEIQRSNDPDINDLIGDCFFVVKRMGEPSGIVAEHSLITGGRNLTGWQKVSFRKIRLWCVGQNVSRHRKNTAAGQTRKTRERNYDRNILKRSKAKAVAEEALAFALENPKDVLSHCQTDENHPVTGGRCYLGITECFRCPSGRRHESMIPALMEVKPVTDALIANSSSPEVVASAAVLQDLVEEQLNAFSKRVRDNAEPLTGEAQQLVQVTIASSLTSPERSDI